MRRMLTRMTRMKLLLIKSKNVDGGNLIINHCINRCNNSFLTISLAVALREIRKYQKSEKLLISKASFRRLFRKIVRDMINENDDLRMQALTIDILQEAGESYICTYLSCKFIAT